MFFQFNSQTVFNVCNSGLTRGHEDVEIAYFDKLASNLLLGNHFVLKPELHAVNSSFGPKTR